MTDSDNMFEELVKKFSIKFGKLQISGYHGKTQDPRHQGKGVISSKGNYSYRAKSSNRNGNKLDSKPNGTNTDSQEGLSGGGGDSIQRAPKLEIQTTNEEAGLNDESSL
mmetsp:Transcript_7874/g.12198  ORF Transcript_7874/g.12198 Transcript_7874/m.12198 type:complete len:109 (+) Transcript_7874:482-808(+)